MLFDDQLLASAKSHEYSIVLVHGIQSHPRRAWEYKSNEPKPTEAKKSSTSGPLHSTLKRISGWGKRIQGKEIQEKEAQNKVPQGETIQSEEVVDKNVKGKEVEGREVQDSGSTSPAPPLATGTHGIQASNSEGGDKYWPLDFLPDKCPSARIIAWGYDTQVTKGYVAATQHNIFSLGRDLLFGLAGDREQEGILGRPIVFVAHSLGGIIVKEVRPHCVVSSAATYRSYRPSAVLKSTMKLKLRTLLVLRPPFSF
jgi:hypothetical protein